MPEGESCQGEVAQVFACLSEMPFVQIRKALAFQGIPIIDACCQTAWGDFYVEARVARGGEFDAVNRQALEELNSRIADVASARSQTVELAKAGSPIAWGSSIVSVLAIAVFAGFVYMLFAKVVPEGMKEALLLLGGSAATGYGMVLSYWLGSSSGSAAKDATLRAAVTQKG
jgi:hypothetical protein